MSGLERRNRLRPFAAARGCDCHLCRPDDSYNDLDRMTIEQISERGWQVICVSANGPCCACEDHDDAAHQGAEPTPPFAYTLGLGHTCGHPELLMSGLDHGLMERALNAVALRVVAGRRLAPGDVLEDVLPGAPVVVERVADVALSETVSWSGWFHRRQPEALAIVWPTETGIFGWQPGAPEFLDQLQPRGWRAPFEHGGGLAVDPPWPFPVPPDHRVFTCTHVLNGHRAILWAVRQSDGVYGEDWTINCGDYPHDLSEMAVVHLAHLVRAAPSLRDLSDLALDEEALRHNPDSGWGRGRLV